MKEEIFDGLTKHEKMLEDLKGRMVRMSRTMDQHTKSLAIKVDMEELSELK